MDNIGFFLVGVFILLFGGLILKLSLKILSKLLINALFGAIMIVLINFFGSTLGINIELSMLTSIFVGIFGVFGVIILLLVG